MNSMQELRKALSDIEKENAGNKVCVTGGTGYIGSCVVRRLLTAGNTVHVACLPEEMDKPDTTKHLKDLPGADSRLFFFPANLLEEGSFDEAVNGCKYVIHMAAVVMLNKEDPERTIIAPALKGVDNVLGSVNRAESVQRVVMTSSVAAIYSKNYQKGAGVAMDESDWPVDLTPLSLPYHYAKTMSEKRAWEIVGKQDRWSLVVINPGVVYGPIQNPTIGEGSSISMPVMFFKGVGWPFCYPLYVPFVDVEDVAHAHILAMLSPKAQGRYVCVSICSDFTDYLSAMKSEFPQYRYPFIKLPIWLIYYAAVILEFLGLSKFLNFTSTLTKNLGTPLRMDTSKIQRELDFKFIDPNQTVQDSIRSLQEHKVLRK